MPNLTDILDSIRHEGLSDLEMYNIIKQFTSFEFEPLKLLLSDVNFYINIERDEFIASLNPFDIQSKLDSMKSNGFTEEQIKNKYYFKIRKPQKKDSKDEFEYIYTLNHEALLFPFEFWHIYQFKRHIIIELNKHQPNFDPDYTINIISASQSNSSNQPTNTTAKYPPFNTNTTFENSISPENQQLILQLMDDLSITLNGKYCMSERKKSVIRGLVIALKEEGKLPNLAIHDLCLIIADKIGLEIKSKLEHTSTAKDMQSAVKKYLQSSK